MPELASQRMDKLEARIKALETRIEKLDPTPVAKEEAAEVILNEEHDENPVDLGETVK